MPGKLNNASVVVTGATSGIGRATSHRFAAKGTRLVLTGRRSAVLDDVAEECRRAGAHDVVTVAADVTDPAALEAVAQQAVDRFGGVDVWVNNASVAAWGKLHELPVDDIKRVLDVNVLGYIHGTRAVVPVFHRQGSGVLINVGSMASHVSEPYNVPYAIAKHGVRALSDGTRQELRLDGLRDVNVVTIMPATIDTPFFQHSANHTGWAVKGMPAVYTPQRVARTIVKNATRPRREVPVGTAARTTILQRKVAPGITERIVATAANCLHLDRDRPAPANSGTLYEPADDDGSIDGGWHGRRKTALRRVATVGVLAAAALAMGRGR